MNMLDFVRHFVQMSADYIKPAVLKLTLLSGKKRNGPLSLMFSGQKNVWGVGRERRDVIGTCYLEYCGLGAQESLLLTFQRDILLFGRSRCGNETT